MAISPQQPIEKQNVPMEETEHDSCGEKQVSSSHMALRQWGLKATRFDAFVVVDFALSACVAVLCEWFMPATFGLTFLICFVVLAFVFTFMMTVYLKHNERA